MLSNNDKKNNDIAQVMNIMVTENCKFPNYDQLNF